MTRFLIEREMPNAKDLSPEQLSGIARTCSDAGHRGLGGADDEAVSGPDGGTSRWARRVVHDPNGITTADVETRRTAG